MKLLIWIIAGIVILAATAFAVTNRTPVEVDFWPLPYAATLPLFVILLVTVVVGFLFGSVVAWWSGRRARRKARERAWHIERLERELDTVKRAAKSAGPGTSQIPATAGPETPQLSAGGAAQT